MEPITLKLSHHQVKAYNETILSPEYVFNPTTDLHKITIGLVYSVIAPKLRKMEFNKGPKYKLKLLPHEAIALKLYLNAINDNLQDPYAISLAMQNFMQIDQKY